MSGAARSVAASAPTISIRNYAIVTAAYWAFTLTDGALRMLVLLHFNELGYTPVQLAFLFLLYEFVGGLVLFGIVFALNSSVHSYLVLAYSEADRVSLSVGFYYMANACGRLLGTLLSGVLYQVAGVSASLWGAAVLAAAAGVGAMLLPPVTTEVGWEGTKGDD
jgi:hypothetical protein